jgi:hypothetical protein
MSEERTPPPTVFGVKDQAEVISRIDAVQDDDQTSSFFGDSIDEVEGAATRMFDIGIRVVAGENPPTADAFGRPAEPSGVATPARVDLPDDLADTDAHRAFILGGPRSLRP